LKTGLPPPSKQAKAAARKLDARRKIIMGGAILAAIADSPGLAAMVKTVLAQRVTRALDRAAVADLLDATPPEARPRLMALYRCEASIISRGKGQSVVAAAAYQARARLYNEQDGLTKDYTRHHGQELLESGIYAPKNAPDWVFDREQLWNAAERAEDAHNKTRAKTPKPPKGLRLPYPTS
jgi:hypothetical protein